MTVDTVRRILCPECECAIRELTDSPCPNCRKCPFCGRRMSRRDNHCQCPLADDPDRVARLQREFGIPEALEAREERRVGAKRRLHKGESITTMVFAVVLVVAMMAVNELFDRTTVATVVFVVLMIGLLVLARATLWVHRRLENRRLRGDIASDE